MLLWWSISKEYKWNIESINYYFLNEFDNLSYFQTLIVITFIRLTLNLVTPLVILCDFILGSALIKNNFHIKYLFL